MCNSLYLLFLCNNSGKEYSFIFDQDLKVCFYKNWYSKITPHSTEHKNSLSCKCQLLKASVIKKKNCEWCSVPKTQQTHYDKSELYLNSQWLSNSSDLFALPDHGGSSYCQGLENKYPEKIEI